MKRMQQAVTAANSKTMNAVGQFELFAAATDTEFGSEFTNEGVQPNKSPGNSLLAGSKKVRPKTRKPLHSSRKSN